MNENYLAELKTHIKCVEIDQPLASYTSLKIGGTCSYLVKPDSITEITLAIDISKKYQIPFHILGNGSNTLILDTHIDGLIIILAVHFNNIYLLEDNIIKADAGTLLKDVCLFALEHELGGMEFAYGIPASIGGAVYMNAGAYDGEMKDIVNDVTFLDKQNFIKKLPNSALEFSYRHSYFMQKNDCIMEATFRLFPKDKTQIKIKMDEFMARRISKQPLEYPSAGSTFKRPIGNYASALIDQSGLRGHCIGGAMVSKKHTGFVINYQQATSDDILNLINHIKAVVFEKTGYKLECEMQIIGNK